MAQEADLDKVKAAAKVAFSHIDGIEGFGSSQQMLIIYIRSSEVQELLPTQFQGFFIKCVLTGEITAN